MANRVILFSAKMWKALRDAGHCTRFEDSDMHEGSPEPFVKGGQVRGMGPVDFLIDPIYPALATEKDRGDT